MPLPPSDYMVASAPALSDCVWAKAHIAREPPFWMCTYNRTLDVWVSRRIQDRRYHCFECDQVERMLKMLKKARSEPTSSRPDGTGCRFAAATSYRAPLLVDVGGNIGMYSLAAAASCFEAVTFEPVPINAHKIITSARRNGFAGRLHVYTVGASDSFGAFDMGESTTNQGEATHTAAKTSKSSLLGTGVARIPVGKLDDMMPLDSWPRTRPVYVKIDVEGGECRALRGMQKFLQGSTIIGFQIETGQPATRACCEELVAWPHGAFSVLRHRHNLCIRDLSNQSAEYPIGYPMRVDTMCQYANPRYIYPPAGWKGPLSGKGKYRDPWPWEVVFVPCEPGKDVMTPPPSVVQQLRKQQQNKPATKLSWLPW